MHSKTPGGIVPVNSNLQHSMISGIFSQAEFLRRLFQSVQISGLFHVFCIDHRNPSKLSVLLIIDKLSCFLSLFYRRLYFIWKNQLLFYFIKSCSVCTQTAEGFSKSQSCFFFYAFYHFQIWKLPRIFVCIKTAFCKSVIKKH